ncbi:DUF1190 domain-containing protein [Phenylobacterium sp. LjRoot219]|uniref:DUF1190 domain-containing protein n=1 Tax=Phenylobacterium sp. LjRoot219 TaxID=3342283 RepID=UPI003ED015A8
MSQKRKRSGSLKLTTMLAGAASFTLVACGDDIGSSTQWDQSSIAQGEKVEAFGYANVDDCKRSDKVPDAECDAAWAAAQKDNAVSAPRYAEQSTCEDLYGAGNCVPRSSGGANFFTPLLAGFVIGQMMDNFGRPYYRGTGLYREGERYGGGYSSGWGGSLGRDYRTGRTVIARQGIEPPDTIRQAPPKVQTRTAVVSRGGFGGGRGFGMGG